MSFIEMDNLSIRKVYINQAKSLQSMINFRNIIENSIYEWVSY